MRPEYINDAFNKTVNPHNRGRGASVPVGPLPKSKSTAGAPLGAITHSVVYANNNHPTSVASKGLGDTVEKIAKATGLDKVAQTFTKVTGKDCGCAKRKAALNQAFPYNN